MIFIKSDILRLNIKLHAPSDINLAASSYWSRRVGPVAEWKISTARVVIRTLIVHGKVNRIPVEQTLVGVEICHF